MTLADWNVFLAYTHLEPAELALALPADFVCGKGGRLVLSLPRWHRQSKSPASEAALLSALVPWGVNSLEVRVEVG